MQVVAVDPRDQIVEVDDPHYRVLFRHRDSVDEFEISGADVVEVLAWAQDRAAARTFSLWVCIPAVDDEVLLIRLAGWADSSSAGGPAHAVTLP
jgi:hypothetical protein